jgi:hypothetical protein
MRAEGRSKPLDAEAARAACQRLIGGAVGTVARPGGVQRRSLRMDCGGRSVIVTCRHDRRRGELEAKVLQALAEQGAPVPQVLAFDGTWLIQEDVGTGRLSHRLAGGDAVTVEHWLDMALASLDRLHLAGRAAGLEHRVVTLGASPDWCRRVIDRAEVVGRQVGIAPPALEVDRIATNMRVRQPWLLKWDARPGNAVIDNSGRLSWIDFEHCGCRNRLDDVAWLLCDEYVPNLPDVEERLLARHLPAFAVGWDATEAAAYLATYGTFHGLVRLSVIIDRKGKGPWWDRRRCLAADAPDVSREGALNVAHKTQRWAGRNRLTAPLAPWLAKVIHRIESSRP